MTPPKSTPLTMSHQRAILSAKGTIFDRCVTQAVTPEPLPILNTMAKPCVSPCAQNGSKVKVLRCKNFGVEESFRKSYRHLSLPKIEFSALASTTRLKVRLVVQGQHIKRKGADGVGDYDDAFSPVSAASGFLTIRSLATQLDMFTDHVDISESQAFVQGELLPGDGHNGNVYISSPPGYEEDSRYIYRLLKPLYGMPSAARAWHTTMSAFLEREGCETVGSKRACGESSLTVTGFYLVRTSMIS